LRLETINLDLKATCVEKAKALLCGGK